MKKLTIFAVLLALLVVSVPGAAAQTFAVESPTTLYFVHGMTQISSKFDDGRPVNLILNDAECLAEDVRFGQIAGPFGLFEGNYKLAIVPAEKGCNPESAIARTAVSLVGDENVSVVAHLTDKGEPALTEFVNFGAASIDTIAWDRLTRPEFVVRNTSTVLSMNALATEEAKGLRVAFDRLYPGGEDRETVADGAWQLSFYQTSPFFSSWAAPSPITTLRVEAKFDTAYFFYAVGSASNGTFRVIQQALPIP